MPDIQLIHGDCFELYAGVKAALTLTDPPYGTTRCKWDTAFSLAAFWEMVKAVSSGFCIAFAQVPFATRLGL